MSSDRDPHEIDADEINVDDAARNKIDAGDAARYGPPGREKQEFSGEQ